ncbi:MAG TPA: hypothetical protein VFC04_03520 [Actinomycetota bacterium]|nr:hypothetical protein [Actinomycetota bacterium]
MRTADWTLFALADDPEGFDARQDMAILEGAGMLDLARSAGGWR